MIQPVSPNQPSPPNVPANQSQPPKDAGTSINSSPKGKPAVTATFSQQALKKAQELRETKFQESQESPAQQAAEHETPAPPSILGGG